MDEYQKRMKEASPYSAVITREQFLFYEMRITARLFCQGLDREQIVERIAENNLFQYPTEKSVRRMAAACINRLESMRDDELISAIADEPSHVSRQVCLYAMMCRYRLVWDFMVTVVGDKYRNLDFSFGKRDVNTFFMGLQEQDDWVAAWSDSTIVRLKQILIKLLVDNEYLDSTSADHLNPVLISPVLESAIRADGREKALPAFNCLR